MREPEWQHASVNFRAPLSTLPVLLAATREQTQRAIERGEFVGRRGLPDGSECVVWAGLTTEPICFATFFEAEHGRVWLDLLYVRPGSRRQGYGTRLLDAVRMHCAAHGGFDEIHFGTRLENAAMRALAAKAGYVETYVDLVARIAPVAP